MGRHVLATRANFLSKFFTSEPRLRIPVHLYHFLVIVITLRRRRGKLRSFIYFAPETTKL